MRLLHLLNILLIILLSSVSVLASSGQPESSLEQSVSETLDLWRDGRYDQFYERLSHRGKMSKERFIEKMKETSIRPACCWQKIENFQVLNEKRTEATVYAKIGLEGSPHQNDAVTREFRLSHENGTWKMHLNDISALSGGGKAKKKHSSHKIKKARSY
jgi:hypothetical protein